MELPRIRTFISLGDTIWGTNLYSRVNGIRDNNYNLFLSSSIKALITAAQAELPPFLPLLVMYEMSFVFNILNASFDSEAETNPTGKPTTSLGVHIPLSISFMISRSAVGALPIATIPPSASLAATRIDASERVKPSCSASNATLDSEI